MPSQVIDIYDPSTYDDGPPHELFAELRRTQPVFWQDIPGEPGYWAVLRHADLVHVAKHPTLYSASEGGVVLENMPPQRLESHRRSLLAMDPPDHNVFRKPLARTFQARVIAGLEGRIRAMCRTILERAAEQRDVDFIADVTASLPTQVIGELMGMPQADWARIHSLAEVITHGQDPEILARAGYAPGESANASYDMALYGMQFAAERRRAEPLEDVTSLILGSDFGGKAMSDLEFGGFFVQLVTAGNDTTNTMLSSGLLALLQHPDQLADLRADLSLIPGAVEEILRYENPLHYFRRTATEDTVLNGTEIAAGDKVAMYYTSANRDEDVFADPQRFDIRRSPNPHLSFGIAEHFCLGVHLARLEGRVFFEELLRTFPTIELTGEPRRAHSNLNNSLKDMPVRLVR
jgi:cytochrome P450